MQVTRHDYQTQGFLVEHHCNHITGGFNPPSEIAAAKHGCRDGRSAGGSFWRAPSHTVNGERREPNVLTGSPRMLNSRGLVAAGSASPFGPCQRSQADYRFGAKSRPCWYRASCSDRQEETSGVLLIESAPDPETDDAVPTAGCSTATISRADLVFKAGPGTAAEAMVAAIAGHPWRSVDRCAAIILV